MALNRIGAQDFMTALSGISINQADTPPFYIPNWPKNAQVTVYLGRRYLPQFPGVSRRTRLLDYRKRRAKIWCTIDFKGDIRFRVKRFSFDRTYCSDGESSEYCDESAIRVITLLLFKAFHEEVFYETIELLKREHGVHNKIVECADAAIKPFIPFLVADRLS